MIGVGGSGGQMLPLHMDLLQTHELVWFPAMMMGTSEEKKGSPFSWHC